jgi:transposase
MTGKELILYILQNNLENTLVLKDGFFVGFMTEEEAAVKFGVGKATIRVWYDCGETDGLQVGDSLYFRKDLADPRIVNKNQKRGMNDET